MQQYTVIQKLAYMFSSVLIGYRLIQSVNCLQIGLLNVTLGCSIRKPLLVHRALRSIWAVASFVGQLARGTNVLE